MLLLGSSFTQLPILSLRTGSIVGKVVGHLFNPHKLKVDALWCQVGGYKAPKLLLVQDIREISMKGVLVNDLDVVCDPEEVVRLKEIIALRFELLGKKVLSGRLPLGKVGDYAVDRESLTIQKLYVEPMIWGRLTTSRLTISRSQVIEVSHAYIRVNSGQVKEQAAKRALRSQSPVASLAPSSAALTEE